MKAYLEITNICNRHCSFCPGTSRSKQFVPASLIRERLAKLQDVDELYLHLLGEPLLHPEFAEIAEYCRQRGIPVTLTTNGTLLLEEKKQILLQNPIFRQINFSLQALAPEETDLLQNILDFCSTALLKRPELYINLRMWDLKKDYSMQERNETFLHEIFQSLHLPQPEKLQFHSQWHSLNLTGRLYLHCNSVFEWPVNAHAEGGKTFCLGLISQFGVLCDGTVVPCCLDSEGLIPLGNIDKTPLSEILNSPKALAIRNGFRKGEAVDPLCKRCTFRKQN